MIVFITFAVSRNEFERKVLTKFTIFFDMSQAMILDRLQSVTFADIWRNLAGILSGPLILFVSKDLIIILLKSLAVGFDISNVLSVLKILFIF